MPIYRLYALEQCTIKDVATAVWDNDQQAIEYAKTWAKGREVELRERDRLVARIEAAQ
jgi:hypothetical protein